ncbi:sterol desaturase family protein [Trinickia sp. LjRoot230]|uniref:sterol desaturase family protein n=1 Tax=Trinickia sp. LjRoot230 TaxID=3342288 RepID=UPI003ECDB4D4
MLHSILASLDGLISALQTWAFIHVLEPLLFKFGWMEYDEDSYDALYPVIVGALTVGAMYLFLRPLEALRPVERWENRKAVRVDVLYTWLVKLGVFNLLVFVGFQPLFDGLQGWLRLHGIANINLDTLWPGVTSRPLVAFAIYVVVLDFAGYWYHRWQHRFGIWWELHAVHHSQRQLSLWSDDRNHLLDDVLQACFLASIALAIGVAPAQFVVLSAVTNVLQGVQHTNARLGFGRVLERLFVSPAFHRRHHAVGYGHEGTAYGCNFGVLFPWWDMLFKTASWSRTVEPTGVRQEIEGESYGNGFFSQHWLAFVRIARRIERRFGARRPAAATADDVAAL